MKNLQNSLFPDSTSFAAKTQVTDSFDDIWDVSCSPTFKRDIQSVTVVAESPVISVQELYQNIYIDQSSDIKKLGPLLCLITIEIDDNSKDEIPIYQNSDPVHLAHQFSKKHQINDSTMYKLMRHVDQSKKDAISQLHQYQQNMGVNTFGKQKTSAQIQQNIPRFELQEQIPNIPTKQNTQYLRSNDNSIQHLKSQKSFIKQEDSTFTFQPMINQQSQKINRSKWGNSNNVFTRLQVPEQNKQELQKEQLNQTSPKVNTLHSIDQIAKKTENNKSFEKSSTSKYLGKSNSIENRLMNYSKIKAINLKALKDKYAQDESIDKHSFRPTININSVLLMKRRSISQQSLDQHIICQKPQQQSSENQTYRFKPQLNKNSIEKVRQKGLSFDERQQQFQNKKDENLSQLIDKQEKENHVKPTKKLINSMASKQKSQNSARCHKEKIWERLFDENDRRNCKLSKQQQQVLTKQTFQRAYLNPISERIIMDQAMNITNLIFKGLDLDGDGFISSSNINLRGVHPTYLEVLAPILFEMDDRDETLNFQGFAYKIFSNRDKFIWKNLVEVKQNLQKE